MTQLAQETTTIYKGMSHTLQIFIAFWVFLIAVFITAAYINRPTYRALQEAVNTQTISSMQLTFRQQAIGMAITSKGHSEFVALHQDLRSMQSLTWNTTDCALTIQLADGRVVNYEIHLDNAQEKAMLTLQREDTWHIGGIGMGLYLEKGHDIYRWLMHPSRFGAIEESRFSCVKYW